MKKLQVKAILTLFLGIIFLPLNAQEALQLNDKEYFETPGLDITFFSDYYPEGHQSGVTIIQHGIRVAANGDLRLEPSPGQWSPVPKGGKREVDYSKQMITQTLWFPDTSKNRVGFNPVDYPDLNFKYKIHISALAGNSVKVVVDLERPLPEEWVGKVGFNLELFPGDLFGKSFLLDNEFGIFPEQPSGKLTDEYGDVITEALATGKTLTIAPEEDLQRITIHSNKNKIELWDGRTNHNNGWFIARSTVASNATKGAVEWIITPSTKYGWEYEPVIQVSQLGYHPGQKKTAIVELDPDACPEKTFRLYKLEKGGRAMAMKGKTENWGTFLRYKYLTMDFTSIHEPGVYQLAYGSKLSHPFSIADDIYGHEAWQPTLDYYLPVQMCHMRVNEKYRVWHDLCHLDDAQMAPPIPYHFDGYKQGAETHSSFKAGDVVPGLDHGGWHDAGDYDLRVESQAGTVWMLAVMIEEFGLDHDATLIDQEKQVVEIHVPDGKNDALQQIEHGLASILGGYRSLGRLYRGIICLDLRQYVMLGDAASMTDNIKGNEDDRAVFTELNPGRELQVIPALAASARVLRSTNPDLADECLATALALWEGAGTMEGRTSRKVAALSELYKTTQDTVFKNLLINMKDEIARDIDDCGWSLGRVISEIDDPDFQDLMANAVKDHQAQLRKEQKVDSPYGVPYKPNIWGAGWKIQRFGVEQYFFHQGWPELCTSDFYENSLNFILGVHPGSNNSSFASGIGSRSVKVAYGVNRADWSFIPGGVASGTALIRPDLPELKIWPYFWQQTEYVMGGGSTNYMFLVLAVNELYN